MDFGLSADDFSRVIRAEEGCQSLQEIQAIALTGIAVAAVLFDLKSGKIPNGLIFTGLLWGAAYQLSVQGPVGGILFLGGAALPILLLGILYYFRMIGAGDIKLLCVTGGFLGPAACVSCMAAAILAGGVISLVIMLRNHNLSQRLLFFSDYIYHYSKERQWNSYLEKTSEADRFCFSVPILLSILSYLGGLI
jgi:prepilin peptidase CpaA